MSHVGNEKDWNGLLEYYTTSPEYVLPLKRVTIAQWVYESRLDENSGPGTDEVSVNAINFAGLRFNARMETFGAGRFEHNGEVFCKFDDVEHFVEGYFYFIGSGGYDRWHQLADRPLDFIAHLEERGFAGNDDQYAEKVGVIYDKLESRFEIEIPEIGAIRHMVVHGEHTFKIAADNNVTPEKVFKLDRNGTIRYGSNIGTLFTGDLLYILTDEQAPAEHGVDPLTGLSSCDRPAGDCAGRTHFVIHQTVAGNLTKERVLTRYGGLRNKAHVYVLKSGEAVFLWNFTEKMIRATKSEFPGTYRPIRGSFPNFPITGKLIHVEVDYEENGRPNEAQYNTLAELYIQACKIVGRILTVVPHIEIDRGIRNGHNDPQNFDYNNFYGVLKGRDIDISQIPKFDHQRYWGQPNFRIPFDTDTFHFPPILTGNPHA